MTAEHGSSAPWGFRLEGAAEDPGRSVLYLEGHLDAGNAAQWLRALEKELGASPPTPLDVDLSNVQYMDDYGALVLHEVRKRLKTVDGTMELVNVPEQPRSILAQADFSSPEEEQEGHKPIRPDFFARLGERFLRGLSEGKEMLIFLGDTIIGIFHVVRHPRSLRWGDTLTYMQRTGVEALPIVGLISFLLGLIMAFMSSVQLKQFGANIYVASLVGLSMTRELGPIMTCIIVAGRSASAYAAEIGSMKVSEEVDALSTMGFDITRFLVMPKVIATLLVVPLLTLFSDVLATFGGLIVGVGMLDLTPTAYVTQFGKTVGLFDVMLGVGKSAVFALLIAWIGCYRGLKVSGGADAVGRATTSAVVSGIFLVIVCDAVFSVILRYWE
jgi:phospholipid/cholesterol/gamma-HCH transport system permease protein